MPQPSGSVLFMDSPDSRALTYKWDAVNLVSPVAGAGPFGGYAYTFPSNNSTILTKSIPLTTSVLLAWYWRLDGSTNSDFAGSAPLQFLGGGAEHIELLTLSSGAVRIKRAGTTIVESAAGLLAADTYYHFQARVEPADAGGRVEVWIDGTQVIDFTGDTRAGGDAGVDIIRFGRVGNYKVSDVVICDSTTPIGVARVVPLLPDGVGSSSALTPSGGAVDNYTMVDEAVPDDDTTYVYSDTEGDKDTYTLDDTPAGTFDVLAVQATLIAKASDAGPKYVRPVLRLNGTDYAGASSPLGASYDAHRHIWDDSPDTATAFTTTELDGAELGPEVRDS